jgi:hypothetical protein
MCCAVSLSTGPWREPSGIRLARACFVLAPGLCWPRRQRSVRSLVYRRAAALCPCTTRSCVVLALPPQLVDHEPEGPSRRHEEPPARRPCAPTFDLPALFYSAHCAHCARQRETSETASSPPPAQGCSFLGRGRVTRRALHCYGQRMPRPTRVPRTRCHMAHHGVMA